MIKKRNGQCQLQIFSNLHLSFGCTWPEGLRVFRLPIFGDGQGPYFLMFRYQFSIDKLYKYLLYEGPQFDATFTLVLFYPDKLLEYGHGFSESYLTC